VNVENKEQSKQWMRANSPEKPKKFKQMSVSQEADGNCFFEREAVKIVEFVQQGTTITSQMHCATLKNCVRPFRTQGADC
jgi:hypothetical protein